MNTCKTHTTAAAILLLAMLIGISPCYGAPKASPTPSPSPSPVSPSENFDLKGFYLGMSKKDVKAVAGKKTICFPAEEVNCVADNFCAIEGLSVAGTKTGSTIFMIKNDRLTGLIVSFSRENFADIAEAFTNKYGKAQKTGTQTVKNRLGSSFEKVDLGWTIKDASVALSNMEDNVNEGQLSVRPIRPSDQMLECLAKEAKAAQSDL